MLRYTPIAIWLLSWLTFAICYRLSVGEGYVESCLPFIEGCTSISKTGRYGTSYFVFKALMMPVATLTIVYWLLVGEWLSTLNGRRRIDATTLVVFGVLSGVFLLLYATFLGSEGEIYRMLRQYGTNLSFLFSFLSHVFLAFAFRRLFAKDSLVVVYIILCAVIALDALTMVIWKQFIVDNSWLENSTEWRTASLLTMMPFMVWLFWRKTEFDIAFTIRRREPHE